MREEGALQVPALLAMGGVDLGYWLKASWPDDIGILEALAAEIQAQRERELKNMATETANRIGEMLEKSFGS